MKVINFASGRYPKNIIGDSGDDNGNNDDSVDEEGDDRINVIVKITAVMMTIIIIISKTILIFHKRYNYRPALDVSTENVACSFADACCKPLPLDSTC